MGIPVYLDETSIANLDDSPYWYCNVLSLIDLFTAAMAASGMSESRASRKGGYPLSLPDAVEPTFFR
jgi:hypothetical protein